MSLSHPLFYYNQVVAYSWNIDMQHVVCAWDVDWESSVSKGSWEAEKFICWICAGNLFLHIPLKLESLQKRGTLLTDVLKKPQYFPTQYQAP